MPEHLFLGQVDNAAAPAAVAAKLYVLSDGYGSPAGTDTPLLVETGDEAPAGPGGRYLLRRAYVTIQYAGACTVKVTPITDFNNQQGATTRTYSSPATILEDTIEAHCAVTCTAVRVRVEVTGRAGVVKVETIAVAGVPIVSAASIVVGAEA